MEKKNYALHLDDRALGLCQTMVQSFRDVVASPEDPRKIDTCAVFLSRLSEDDNLLFNAHPLTLLSELYRDAYRVNRFEIEEDSSVVFARLLSVHVAYDAVCRRIVQTEFEEMTL